MLSTQGMAQSLPAAVCVWPFTTLQPHLQVAKYLKWNLFPTSVLTGTVTPYLKLITDCIK